MRGFVNDYQNTGLIAVDMVASVVSHYRRHYNKVQKPIKAICLSPKYFVQFTDWVRFNLEKEGRVEQAEANVEQYLFDGVEVKMNSVLMGEQTYFEFYENKPVAQA
jgi:predicted ATPase